MAANESSVGRNLDPGEPQEPTEAYLEFTDGRRIDLRLERAGQRLWRAYPPEPVSLPKDGAEVRIDRLPAGGEVQVMHVYAMGGADEHKA